MRIILDTARNGRPSQHRKGSGTWRLRHPKPPNNFCERRRVIETYVSTVITTARRGLDDDDDDYYYAVFVLGLLKSNGGNNVAIFTADKKTPNMPTLRLDIAIFSSKANANRDCALFVINPTNTLRAR